MQTKHKRHQLAQGRKPSWSRTALQEHPELPDVLRIKSRRRVLYESLEVRLRFIPAAVARERRREVIERVEIRGVELYRLTPGLNRGTAVAAFHQHDAQTGVRLG